MFLAVGVDRIFIIWQCSGALNRAKVCHEVGNLAESALNRPVKRARPHEVLRVRGVSLRHHLYFGSKSFPNAL